MSVDATKPTEVYEQVLDFGPIYDDGTWQYFGEAEVTDPSAALSDSVWRVSRIHKTTGQEQYANGGNFNNAYTDLSTAQGLFS